ncbi:MAG: NAD-dependent epimerase/dehydratase family protein [Bacteroidota bacterium]
MSTSPARSVVLLGATGLVGSACLPHLAALYDRVVILTRRTVAGPLAPNVEQHMVDLAVPATYERYLAVDHVVCALGTTMRKAGSRERFYEVDFSYPYEVSRRALRQGASHFMLVSSAGANPNAWAFYSRVKGELEVALRMLGYRSLSLLRPSVLGGSRQEFRPAETVGKHLMRFLPLRYRTIEPQTLAAALARIAHMDLVGVRTYESDDLQRLGGHAELAPASEVLIAARI